MSAISSGETSGSAVGGISPPSSFCNSAWIESTTRGLVVHENDGRGREELETRARLAQNRLIIARGLLNGSSLDTIRKDLSCAVSKKFYIGKIPKKDGLYVKYKQNNRAPPKIFHYFMKEDAAHTTKVRSFQGYFSRPVYMEEIDEQEFNALKMEIKVLFMPENSRFKTIIEAIDSAEKSIEASTSGIKNENIVNALKRAKSRGIQIRESSNTHDKFMTVDGEIIFSGNRNWTTTVEGMARESLAAFPKSLFFRKEDIDKEIIRLIQDVKLEKEKIPRKPQFIDITLPRLTTKEMAKELFDAYLIGVDIRIVLDKSQEKYKDFIIRYVARLEKKYDSFPIDKRGSLGIVFHRIPESLKYNKFAVIGTTTVIGSHDVIIPHAAKYYLEEFERLYKDSDPVISLTNGRPPDAARAPPGHVINSSTANGVRQYLEGTDTGSIPSFENERYEMRKAEKDIVLYRVFDYPEGTAYPAGKWASKPDNLMGSPEAIIDILRLYTDDRNKPFNKATFRIPVVIKENTIFAHGAVAGGDGWQTYIPGKYMPVRGSAGNQYVKFDIENLEVYDERSSAWVRASDDIIKKLRNFFFRLCKIFSL